MTMKRLSIGTILNDYQSYLTDNEIKKLREIQKTPSDFATQTKAIKHALFEEEGNFMAAENADSWFNGNTWSKDYIDRVNRKRKAFGVGPVNENSSPVDRSSDIFCEEVVRQTKNYKELLDLKRRKAKQVVFIDMDNVLVDFQSGIDRISEEEREKYAGDLDDVPGIFSLMDPMEGAIEAYEWISKNFDTYILSTAPWDNPSAWHDKLLWVKKHLPELAYKRLILSHNKHLAKGDFLIDDRTANGAGEFSGKHIHFGKEGEGFETWKDVIAYLRKLA